MQFSPALTTAVAVLLCFHGLAVAQQPHSAQIVSRTTLQQPFVEVVKAALAKFSSTEFLKKPDAKGRNAQIQRFDFQARQLDAAAGSLREALDNYAYARIQNAALLQHARQGSATIPLSFKKSKYVTSVFFEGDGPLRILIQSVDNREEACRSTIASTLNQGQIQSDFQECELASVDPRSDPLPFAATSVATQTSGAGSGPRLPNPVFKLRSEVALQSIEDLQSSFIGSFGVEGVLGQLLSESRINLANAAARGGAERSLGKGLEELFHLRALQLEMQIGAERRLLAKLIPDDSDARNNDTLIAQVSQRLPEDPKYALASARYQSCRDQIRQAISESQKLAHSESCSAGAR